MLYDLSTPLKDRSGKDISGPGPDGAMTVAIAVVNALDAPSPQSEALSGVVKAERFMLGSKIMAANGKIDLTVEEAALCKKVVGDGYAPLIVGQVWECFEAKKPDSVEATA